MEVPQVLLRERIMEVPEVLEDELVKQVPRVEYLEAPNCIELSEILKTLNGLNGYLNIRFSLIIS